jgi:hypothetical protein
MYSLRTDVSNEEATFGFACVDTDRGPAAIVAIGHGLYAVKVHGDDGSTEYAICNADMHFLYESARTLEELVKRFGQAR